jgi:hypothetical protein
MDEPEKLKRSEQQDPRNAPCHICGGTEFEWGKFIDQGHVAFKADNSGLFGGIKYIQVRECLACGNVQSFTARKG